MNNRRSSRIYQKSFKINLFFLTNIFDSLLTHSCLLWHQRYLKQYVNSLLFSKLFVGILCQFFQHLKGSICIQIPFNQIIYNSFKIKSKIGPVLISVGMVSAWGTAVGVGMAVNDNSNVPSHRGQYVASYRYGQAVQTWSYNPDELVIYLKTKSCHLIHGSVSWLTTALKNTVTLELSDPLEHWWIIIEKTAVIQFYSNDVYTMVRCNSEYDCNMNGLNCVNNESNATIWTENQYTGNPRKGVKLGDILQWIKQKNFSAQYHLMTHNCQDLCKAVWRAF